MYLFRAMDILDEECENLHISRLFCRRLKARLRVHVTAYNGYTVLRSTTEEMFRAVVRDELLETIARQVSGPPN